MLRRIALALVATAVPIVLAYIVMYATNDPDEGANIGGGLLVLLSFPVGIVSGVVCFLMTASPAPPGRH